MLEGDCTVEEAEPLLQMLQDGRAAPHARLDHVQSPAHGGPPGDPGGPARADRTLRGSLGRAVGFVQGVVDEVTRRSAVRMLPTA